MCTRGYTNFFSKLFRIPPPGRLLSILSKAILCLVPRNAIIKNYIKMKHAIVLLVTAAALFTSCNNSGESATAKDESKKDETKVASASTETKMDYAYTIEHPD